MNLNLMFSLNHAIHIIHCSFLYLSICISIFFCSHSNCLAVYLSSMSLYLFIVYIFVYSYQCQIHRILCTEKGWHFSPKQNIYVNWIIFYFLFNTVRVPQYRTLYVYTTGAVSGFLPEGGRGIFRGRRKFSQGVAKKIARNPLSLSSFCFSAQQY